MTNSLQDQCLSCDTGLVQINLVVNWELQRLNILDVLKPTEEETLKYNQEHSSPFEESPGNISPKFTFKEEYEDSSSNSKRNQKPSK
jgi:hypothetical protein